MPIRQTPAKKTLHLSADENARVTRLDLSHASIRDISGIENFTALRWLDLSHNRVVTSHISALTNLTELNLMGNNIKDVNDLSGLTKLKRFNLPSASTPAFENGGSGRGHFETLFQLLRGSTS